MISVHHNGIDINLNPLETRMLKGILHIYLSVDDMARLIKWPTKISLVDFLRCNKDSPFPLSAKIGGKIDKKSEQRTLNYRLFLSLPEIDNQGKRVAVCRFEHKIKRRK